MSVSSITLVNGAPTIVAADTEPDVTIPEGSSGSVISLGDNLSVISSQTGSYAFPLAVSFTELPFGDINVGFIGQNHSSNPHILKIVPVASVNGVLVLPARTNDAFEVVLSENITSITVDGWPSLGKSQRCVIYFRQDATGGRTVTGWPSNVYVSDGLPLEITLVPSSLSSFVLSSIDAGATLLLDQVGANYLPISP